MDAGQGGQVLLRYPPERSMSSKILRNYGAQFCFGSWFKHIPYSLAQRVFDVYSQ
jgi:hypothetical protein